MIKLFKVKPATKQSGTSGLTLSQFLLQQKPRGIAILPSPEIVSLSIVGRGKFLKKLWCCVSGRV